MAGILQTFSAINGPVEPARIVNLYAPAITATGSGLSLPDVLLRGVTVTNGNALTAAIVRDNVVDAAAIAGCGTAARVASALATDLPPVIRKA